MARRINNFKLGVRSFNSSKFESVMSVLTKLPEEVRKTMPPIILKIFLRGMKDAIKTERISPFMAILAGVKGVNPGTDVGQMMASTLYNVSRGAFVKAEGSTVAGALKTRSRAMGKLWRMMHSGHSVTVSKAMRVALADVGFPLKQGTRTLAYRSRDVFSKMLRKEGKTIKQQMGVEIALIANRLVARA